MEESVQCEVMRRGVVCGEMGGVRVPSSGAGGYGQGE